MPLQLISSSVKPGLSFSALLLPDGSTATAIFTPDVDSSLAYGPGKVELKLSHPDGTMSVITVGMISHAYGTVFLFKPALLGNGSILVTWADKNYNAAPSTSVFASIVDTVSLAVIPSVQLGTAANNYEMRDINVTPLNLADGKSIVFWVQPTGDISGLGLYDVMAQRLATDGSLDGAAYKVGAGSSTNSNYYSPVILEAHTLDDGRVLVNWSKSSVADTWSHSAAAILAADGSIQSHLQHISGQVVAQLGNGNLVGIWDAATTLKSQVYSSDGDALGSSHSSDVEAATSRTMMHATQISDGRVLVSWIDRNGISGQFIDENGIVAGRSFSLRPTSSFLVSFEISDLGNGKLELIYGSFAQTGISPITSRDVVDLYNFIGTAQQDYWTGGAASEVFHGAQGNDVIFGGGGDDSIYGEKGNDILSGGSGNDIIDGGDGTDTLSFWSGRAVTASLDGSLIATNDSVGDQLISIENITGSDIGNDKLSGDALGNTLTGAGGNDELYGRAGDDILIGSEGADLLDGGAGYDIAKYEDVTGVILSLANPIDSRGAAKGDVFVSIEAIWGTNYADKITGNGASNELYGLGGEDALYGGGGNDLLIGGIGRDLLNGGAGRDTVSYEFYSPASVALDHSIPAGGSARGDTLVSIENLTGSARGGDHLIGNKLANVLLGLAGNDILEGRGGGDRIDGGDGLDTVSYAVATIATTIYLNGTIASTGAARGDKIINVENAIGSKFNDTISGSNEDNILDGLDGDDKISGGGGYDQIYGRAGNDELRGGAGNDSLYGQNGNDTLEGDAGADLLIGDPYSFDYASYEHSKGVKISMDYSIVPTNEARGDIFEGIVGLIGSRTGADTLVGDSTDNVLIGLGGNDVLRGRAGIDDLLGGLGKDVLDGGIGEDHYIYQSVRECGDTITNFSSLDFFLIDGQAFGLGSYTGFLKGSHFTTGSNLKSSDSGVQFIYRTTDHSLWFDRDGSGAGGPVLVATITNGIELKADSIYII
jgi:Ca2+-binding RTX toxin-like protein